MVCEENNNRVMDEINLDENIAPLDPTKKKKKKVTISSPNDVDVHVKSENISDNIKADDKEEVRSNQQTQSSVFPWEGTDRDYLYSELLDKVFSSVGDRQKTQMKLPVPQVLRQGSKKTVHVNFMYFCKAMHRQPAHLSSFVGMELSVDVSLDEKQQLVVNGRFAPKHFETILRKYATEYVICNGCKGSNTNLCKENRLMFLRCEQCGSERSVPLITLGYRAQIGRRKSGAGPRTS